MSDSLPTISADQLTKAVSLAAGGALSALDVEATDSGWQKTDDDSMTASSSSTQTSLKLLENLSTSVTSNLGKLNELNAYKPSTNITFSSTTCNTRSNKLKNDDIEKSPLPVYKKYSSRKNYKLLPPLTANQIKTNFRKPGPKTVLQRQLVTLSHQTNLCSPQELKSMPVRAARYTTKYLLVPSSQSMASNDMVATSPSAPKADGDKSSTVSQTSVVNTVNLTPGSKLATNPTTLTLSPISTSPAKASSCMQIVFPISAGALSTPPSPSGPPTVVCGNSSKQLPRLLPSSKFQQVIQLPHSINGVQPNLVFNPGVISNENGIIYIQNMNTLKLNVNQQEKIPDEKEETVNRESDLANPTKNLSLTNNSSEENICNVVTNLKTISAIVSCSQNETFMVSTMPQESVPPRTNQLPTVTIDNSKLTSSVSHSSPQTFLVTNVGGHPAITHSTNLVSTPVNSIMMSPGHILLATPNFQFVPASRTIQLKGTPSMKVPITSTQEGESTTNIAGKQQTVTQSKVKAAVSQKIPVFVNHVISSAPKILSSTVHPPANAMNSAGSHVENGYVIVSNVSSAVGKLDKTTLDNNSKMKTAMPNTTSQPIQLIKTHSEGIYTQPNLSKPVTTLVIAVQPGMVKSVTHLNKMGKTVTSSQSTPMSTSHQPITGTSLRSSSLAVSSVSSSIASNVLSSDVTTATQSVLKCATDGTTIQPSVVAASPNIIASCPVSASSIGPSQNLICMVTSPAFPVAQQALPLTVLSSSFKPQHLQKPAAIQGMKEGIPASLSSKHTVQPVQFLQAKYQAGSDTQTATTTRTQPPGKLLSLHSPPPSSSSSLCAQVSSHYTMAPVGNLSQTSLQSLADVTAALFLSNPTTLCPKTDSSLPLSKVAAAAAMVSLSSMNASLTPIFHNASRTTASLTSTIVNPPVTSPSVKPAPPQFLIPSSDGTKLVISPAGIEHLQSLLRKQGISEGYFIITSPRLPPAFSNTSKAHSVVLKNTIPSHTGDNITIKSEANSLPKSASSVGFTTEMEDCFSKTASINNNSVSQPFGSENIVRLSASDIDGVQKAISVEDNVAVDTDGSESKSCSSSEARSSPAALVIEMDEDRMDTDRADAIGTPDDSSHRDEERERSSDAESYPKHQQDITWGTENDRNDHGRQCIPQSPLSLSDLIRQQQHRMISPRQLEYNFLTSSENKVKESEMEVPKKENSVSPQLSTSESHDFQFPIPLCPASAFGAMNQQQHQQQTDSEIQVGFQHGVYASSAYSNDLSFESSVDLHSSVESRVNQQHRGETSSAASPKLMPHSMNIASPKSPLSVNSTQTLDQGAPLNPPMTPNTMLINLLNSVPTPPLTNHQDLLSVPTSQENSSQDTETANEFDMPGSKADSGLYSGKNMDFASENHAHLGSTQMGDENLLYGNTTTQSLSNNTLSYSSAQNALELIAANYASRSTRSSTLPHQSDPPQLSSSFLMASKSFSQPLYSHCVIQNESQPVSYSENYHQEPDGHDACHSYHCKSCPGPLLVTVNLDSDATTYTTVSLANSGEQKAPAEIMMEAYEQPPVYGQPLTLQPHTHSEERSDVSSSISTEKSGETDILRHLILNTSTSSFHTLQPVQDLSGQHYNAPGTSFSMPQNHQESQFECRVESFLEPDDQHHETLSEADMDQSSSFPSQDENFLHLNHVHNQPSPSFDNTNTSYKGSSFQTTSHQSYENTVSSSFDDENNTAMENPASSSFIMEDNMAGDSSFGVQGMSKSSMPVPHNFLESDNRLQHLATFRSEDPQNEMFYQHSHPQHHYDPSDPHQNHSLEYHLPPSHPPHQYPTSSLPHQDSSRMYQDHAASVVYMDGQYPSQYYDSGNVASNLPMFSQQCAVGSEAPVLGSSAGHPCNIPFSNAPTGLQLEYRFPPEDDDAHSIEKQPVLPSASFSPPSVADQAATPELGGLSTYNGTFPNLSMYDMYIRGGHSDARGTQNEATPETGNFCVECNMMYKAQCKFHPCDYTYVSDTPILSHARLTVPGCLKLGTSSIVGHTNNTGVFAREKISARTKFGPLIGSPVSCDKLGSTRSFSLWQTFSGTNAKVMDTSDENSSNWLMFVKPARVSAEQNLVAFQHGSCVYFVTRVDIEPDKELLYWFAKDYARMLGITAKPKNAHHQLCPHCTVCKQVFPDRKQVCSHMRLQHPKPCTKKCSHCSRKFLKTSHLNVHIMSVHLREKKHVCPHCGKRFADSSNFSKHVKAHVDERLFKCHMCSKDFRQKAHLKNHMNTHMPVMNEQCGFCGKRFTRAFTRKQHELQHTKQNKIQCVHCDKIFYKQKVYKQHLKIHRNERNYVCQHCSKAFRTKGDLTRHGPACKQRKCVVIPPSLPQTTLPPPPPPPPPPPATSQMTGDFLHTSHSDG